MEKALYRARKHFGKKLTNMTISEFKDLCQTLSHSTDRTERPVHHRQPQTNHTEKVCFVRGFTNPLSNFCYANFTFQSIVYKTVEHAFHHQKALYFDHYNLADEVYTADRPYKARTITSKIKKTKNWLNSRTKLMYAILKAKYQQVATFRNAVNNSGNSEIIHNVVDPFWGSGKEGNGWNKYGTLLTQLRKEKPVTYAECVTQQQRNKMREQSKPSTTLDTSSHTGQDTIELVVTSSTSKDHNENPASPSNQTKEHCNNQNDTPEIPPGTNKHNDSPNITKMVLRSQKQQEPEYNGTCNNQNDTPEIPSETNKHNGSPSITKRVLRSQKQQKPECNSAYRTVHKRTKNKDKDWQIPTILNDTLILGDSNLARIETHDLPPNTQIESFPGAKLHHIPSVVTKYPENKPKPKRVILSIGINNRDCNLAESKQDCKEMFASIKQQFPKCEIAFCELNFSDKLSTKAKNNLSSINKFVHSLQGITNIPPVEKAKFISEKDNIHWKPKTANYMINWWFQNLNY